jgi:hypothetical protein
MITTDAITIITIIEAIIFTWYISSTLTRVPIIGSSILGVQDILVKMLTVVKQPTSQHVTDMTEAQQHVYIYKLLLYTQKKCRLCWILSLIK